MSAELCSYCMIPASGMWLSRAFVIFCLTNPRSFRTANPTGETWALSPTPSITIGIIFVVPFCFTGTRIPTIVPKNMLQAKIMLWSRKVLQILLVESIRILYVILEIILSFVIEPWESALSYPMWGCETTTIVLYHWHQSVYETQVLFIYFFFIVAIYDFGDTD